LAHEVLRDSTTGPLALEARKILFGCHYMGGDIKACRMVLSDIISQVGLNTPDGQDAARYRIQTYQAFRLTTDALTQTHEFLHAATTGTAFWADLKMTEGDLLRESNQLTTAQNVYAQVFQDKAIDDQRRFKLLARLATVYATTQSAAGGIEFFEKYLADEPSTTTIPHTYMILGQLSSLNKQTEPSKAFYNKAFEAFGQMYERASGADEKIDVLIQYARACEFAGELDKAATLLQKGLQDFPTSSRRINLYYTLAELLARNKKYDEAMAVYREIPTQFPNDPKRVNAYFYIADCHRMQKKFEAAVADYQEIMALFPGTPFAQNAARAVRDTEEMRRREAETTATLPAALPTSPTLGLTSGAATTSPLAARSPLPPPPAELLTTAVLPPAIAPPTTSSPGLKTPGQ